MFKSWWKSTLLCKPAANSSYNISQEMSPAGCGQSNSPFTLTAKLYDAKEHVVEGLVIPFEWKYLYSCTNTSFLLLLRTHVVCTWLCVVFSQYTDSSSFPLRVVSSLYISRKSPTLHIRIDGYLGVCLIYHHKAGRSLILFLSQLHLNEYLSVLHLFPSVYFTPLDWPGNRWNISIL